MNNTADKLIQQAIGAIIQKHVVTPLMKGECAMRESELVESVRAFCHIEKDIEETCILCNGCDPKTLKRWSENPEVGFPTYHKGAGDKKYYWLDEIESWKMNHQEILERVEQKKHSR